MKFNLQVGKKLGNKDLWYLVGKDLLILSMKPLISWTGYEYNIFINLYCMVDKEIVDYFYANRIDTITIKSPTYSVYSFDWCENSIHLNAVRKR